MMKELRDYILEKPDIEAFVGWPYFGSRHVYLNYSQIAVRGDCSFVWDWGGAGGCCLFDGNHPSLSIAERVSEIEQESNAVEFIARSAGRCFVEFPWGSHVGANERGTAIEQEFHREVPGRLAPRNCTAQADFLRKFIQEMVIPLPPFREILKMRLSPGVSEMWRAGNFSGIASLLRRADEDFTSGTRWTGGDYNWVPGSFECQSQLLESIGSRHAALKKRRAARGAKSKPNFFSMVNATEQLTKLKV
jgi:hypothetical protein